MLRLWWRWLLSLACETHTHTLAPRWGWVQKRIGLLVSFYGCSSKRKHWSSNGKQWLSSSRWRKPSRTGGSGWPKGPAGRWWRDAMAQLVDGLRVRRDADGRGPNGTRMTRRDADGLSSTGRNGIAGRGWREGPVEPPAFNVNGPFQG